MIDKYIILLRKEHVLKFARNLGYELTTDEVNFIYNKIKNNYRELINDPRNIFTEGKIVLRRDIYNKCVDLYNEYKKKLENYL